MDFKLNFLGIVTPDFDASFHFYSEVLGIQVKRSKPHFAAFQTTGMKFELFSGGQIPTSTPAVRPSLHTTNPENLISDLHHKGVKFITNTEFITPEGNLWTINHAPTAPSDLSIPRIGQVTIHTPNLPQQQAFYANLHHPGSDEPLLILEPNNDTPHKLNSNLFVGFETADIHQAANYLKLHNITLTQDIAAHSWGIDIYTNDVDGNPIQIAQYT